MRRKFILDCLKHENDEICLGYLRTIADFSKDDGTLKQLVIKRIAECCEWGSQMKSNRYPRLPIESIPCETMYPIDFDRLYRVKNQRASSQCSVTTCKEVDPNFLVIEKNL